MQLRPKTQILHVILMATIVFAVCLIFTGTSTPTSRPLVRASVIKHVPVFGQTIPTAGPAGTIYLSFDDGPSIVTTPHVLQVLSQFGARATFFTIGYNVVRYPQLIEQEYLQGNSVQNHTYDHISLKGTNQDVFNSEVNRDQAAITSADGVAPACVRAPYDDFNQETIDRLHAMNMNLIGWNIDSNDWRNPGVPQILQNVLGSVKSGDIILMHDGGGYDRTQTIEALQQLIPALRDRGFGFGLLCNR